MKEIMKRAARVAVISVIGAVAAPAQTPEAVSAGSLNGTEAPGYISRGVTMLGDANVRGALDQLDEALRLYPTAGENEKTCLAAAIAAMSVPGEDAAARLEAFLRDYPASPLCARALLALADVWFDRGEYAAALEAYGRIPAGLDPSLAEDADYRRAYCLLKFADYRRASAIYSQLEQSPVYGNAARFYQGYIAYAEGNYSRAAELFAGVHRQGMPTAMADYYLAQMHYMAGRSREAAATAQALLARTDVEPQFAAEARRIAGESLYALGDTGKGLALLNEYVASTADPQPSALYLLGVDDYENGLYRQAIDRLSHVSDQDNAMGQSACLHIGQSYLKLDNNNAATLALEKASRMAHDRNVQETAFYNLAVARMQGGRVPFGSSVSLFEEFLTRYPESEYVPEVAGYLVTGYMTDNNYAAALAAIDKVKNPGRDVLSARQKVLYSLGARELQGGDAGKALPHLQEAASMTGYDRDIAAEATLWTGECRYKLGDYTGAVKAYNSYLQQNHGDSRNRAIAYYDLGYARFARKEFKDARADFARFIRDTGKGTNRHLLADAYNRMADAQYYTSDFAGAAENYARAYETDPASGDYPMYQQGLMQGLRRDHEGKIATLIDMAGKFPASALVPSALLEMAESYGELGRTDRAIETYTSLVSRYPNTAQGRQGQLLLAITYLNAGNRRQAMEHYRRVISRYPSSDEARVATDDLKQLYADEGRVGDYVAFINTVPDAPKPETAELARLTLTGAEKAIEEGRDSEAIAQASEVIAKYPDSPQAVDALAIKADAEYRAGKAADALVSYTALEERASEASDVNAARMGIMRVCRDMGENERAIETADRLLASSALGASGKREVTYVKALALADTGHGTEALELWETLAADIDDIYGTKSAFNIAEHYAGAGNDKKALEAVNRLIEANPPHDYWLARGFILLSDLLRRKGDKFEADEYLRSLRENYPGTEADIFRMIDERLEK